MPASTYQYNVNPSTQSGSGTYGAVAGATELPDVYSELSSVYPELGTTNTATSSALLSKLQGQLSPATINALQDASARYGVSSGMPMSGLTANKLFGNIAGWSEKQQQEGLQDYSSIIPTVSKTQTISPETQISTSQSNAALAAQANPEAASNYALDLYNEYLDRMDPNSVSNITSQYLGNILSGRLGTNLGTSGTTHIGGPSQVSGSFGTPTTGTRAPSSLGGVGGVTGATGTPDTLGTGTLGGIQDIPFDFNLDSLLGGAGTTGTTGTGTTGAGGDAMTPEAFDWLSEYGF